MQSGVLTRNWQADFIHAIFLPLCLLRKSKRHHGSLNQVDVRAKEKGKTYCQVQGVGAFNMVSLIDAWISLIFCRLSLLLLFKVVSDLYTSRLKEASIIVE